MKSASAIAAAAAIVFAAVGARAEEPAPLAPTLSVASSAAPKQGDVLRYPPSSTRVFLIAGGATMFGASYGLSVFASETWSDAPGASALKIPVAGPWISFFQNGCPSGDCGAAPYIRGVLTALDAFAQLGGLGLVAEGIFITTEAKDPALARKPSPRFAMQPFPVVTADHTGVGVIGTF